MADPTVTPLFGVPTTPAAMQPAGAVQGATVAPRAPVKYEEQDGKHKGVAGVARDVLGTLGDFLLTRLHMPAMYAPAQAQRKLSAAESGMDVDPIAAIQRVESINPVFGAKLRDQFIDNQRLEATRASTEEARQQRLGLAQTAQNDRTRARAAAMLGTMSQWDEGKRGEKYSAMRDQAIRYAKANGLDLSTELPTSYDGTALDSFIDSSVPVGTQRTQRLVEQKNADTNEYRTNNLGERTRHNQATESIGQDRVGETGRHNQVAEGQGDQRIRQGDRRLNQADTREANNVTESARRDTTTRRGQDLRPQKPTDPAKLYTQGGKFFRYDPASKTYKEVKR